MTYEDYMKKMEEHSKSLDNKYDLGNEKSRVLRKFELDRLRINELFFDEMTEAGFVLVEKIVNLIKKQELTYEQAYATLEQVYNQLKYESNFTKIPSVK